MALVVFDRVQQTGTANTTVSFTLSGSVTGYQSFSVVGNGNTTFYGATDTSGNWEVGVGTYATGGTLTRTTILSSSNSGSAVTFSGTVNVFITYPSERSVNLDASGNVTALGTITSGVWNGTTIPVAYGGTGVTSSSGANSVVLRDTNQNVTYNNFIVNSTTVTAAAGTTILTVASARNQILVGSTTQTFQLPDATTLRLGQSFLFINNSTGVLTVKDNASATVESVPSGGVTQLGVLNIGTAAGTWGAYSFLPGSYDFSASTANFGGANITNATYQANTIQPGYGGTGLTTFSAANNALYSTGASTLTAGTLPILAGGTGSTTASGARSSLGAAASGANSDITSLSGLTTPLSVPQGGTGLSSVTANRIPYGNGTSALQTNVNFTYNGTTLLVGDSGGLAGATNPVIASVGSANNYVQSYIYNTSNGTNTSADFTAYPANGSDASGWVDMGITSLNFNQASYSVTGPNEAYLFGSSPSTASTTVTGNLVYATDSNGSANYHQWYVGGFNQAKNAWKMQLTGTGLQLANALAVTYGGTGATTASAGFNNLSPITSTGDLIVGNGTNSATRLGIGTSGQVLTSNGTTATWSAPAGSSTLNIAEFTATSGQTTFSVTYTVGLVEGVYRNGIKLGTADYTASNGTTVVLGTGAVTGDLIQVVYFTAVAVSTVVNTISFGSTGLTPSTATSGAVTVAGTLGVANGGTGATSATAYGVLCGGTTSTGAYQSVASVGTSGQVLTSNGAGALPTFQNAAGATITGTSTNATYYVVGTTSTSGSLTTASISNTNVVSYNASTGALTAVSHVSSSDERLKSNIQTLTNAVQTVESLRGVSYLRNDKPEIGVVAQEVEKILPMLVQEDPEGYKTVAYGNMVGLLIEAVKELSAEVKALKAELNK